MLSTTYDRASHREVFITGVSIPEAPPDTQWLVGSRTYKPFFCLLRL